MYYRLVASITRDHIREHLQDYLDVAEVDLDTNTKLTLPKSFDVASFVGGVVGITGKGDFPAMAIDAHSKAASPTTEDLYTQRYDGQITWMVGGDNPKVVEQQAKGYGAALEMFITDHRYKPFVDSFDESALPFSFVEFGFIRSEFFGAASVEVEQRGQKRLWVDGGRLEIAWITSERGQGQHE